jgi:hypothetical protein
MRAAIVLVRKTRRAEELLKAAAELNVVLLLRKIRAGTPRVRQDGGGRSVSCSRPAKQSREHPGETSTITLTCYLESNAASPSVHSKGMLAENADFRYGLLGCNVTQPRCKRLSFSYSK